MNRLASANEAAQYSEGVRYVLVKGTLVVRDGRLQEDFSAGAGHSSQVA
jgi:hypothetical protein